MGAHRRLVSMLLQRWLATEMMHGNSKSKVGRKWNFTVNSCWVSQWRTQHEFDVYQQDFANHDTHLHAYENYYPTEI